MESTEKQLIHDNGNQVNRFNKVKVLNAIRNAKRISRIDIVHQTGISAPTVTRIVDDLITKDKLVRQIGLGESKGGRPPKIIEFNGEKNYVIGIDWGRTHINSTITDLNAKTILEIDAPSTAHQDFDKDLQRIYSIIDYLIKKSGIDQSKLLGIGIAAAGYINNKGVIEYSPNFNWKNINLKKPIAEKFRIPVIIQNVVRAMAIGELYYGNHGLDDFIFVNVGYGIGSGIISEGRPLTGFDGISGEIGHTRIFSETNVQRKCVCGKHNCLECFASGRGIEEIAKERINNHPESVVNLLTNFDSSLIDVKKLATAANKGDEFALRIFLEAADILGVSIANMTNLLNPKAVILGGRVITSGDFFINRLYEVFQREQLSNISNKVKMIKTSIPGKVAAKGAVGLILRELLNLNIQ